MSPEDARFELNRLAQSDRTIPAAAMARLQVQAARQTSPFGVHQRLDRLQTRLVSQPDPREVDALIEERDALLETIAHTSPSSGKATTEELALVSPDELNPEARRRFEDEVSWLALGLRDAKEAPTISKLLARSRTLRLALSMGRFPARKPPARSTIQ